MSQGSMCVLCKHAFQPRGERMQCHARKYKIEVAKEARAPGGWCGPAATFFVQKAKEKR